MTREQFTLVALAFPAAGFVLSAGKALAGWPGLRLAIGTGLAALAVFYALDLTGIRPGGVFGDATFVILGIPLVALLIVAYALGRGATEAARALRGRR